MIKWKPKFAFDKVLKEAPKCAGLCEDILELWFLMDLQELEEREGDGKGSK